MGDGQGLTLGVKDCVCRVGVEGVLGSVTDQAFLIGERDPRRRDTMSLVIGNDVYATFLLYAIGRQEHVDGRE